MVGLGEIGVSVQMCIDGFVFEWRLIKRKLKRNSNWKERENMVFN